MGKAIIIDEETKEVLEYYLDDRLKRSLDIKVIPSLQQNDKDCVMVVDGREGSGKSTLALQLAKYVDPSFSLKRVVFSPDNFREAILKAKKGQAIVYDEAFTGFSSRASLSPVNRVLVSLAMQMRQKNLFVIIVLPTIFLLDKYMALFRTRALIHVYENHGKRGYFRLYNSKVKKLLILLGNKTMSYSPKIARTNFKGRFYGKFALGDKEVEDEYRTMKEKALSDSEKTPMTSAQLKYKEQRDVCLWLIRKKTQLKYREFAEYLTEYGIEISFSQLRTICAKYGDSDGEPLENDIKSDDKEQDQGVGDRIVFKKPKKTKKDKNTKKTDDIQLF